MNLSETMLILREQGSLRSQDCYFADLIARACDSKDENLLMAAALVSHAVGKGDICLDLEAKAGAEFPARDDAETGSPAPGEEGEVTRKIITLPGLDKWLAALRSREASVCVGKPGEQKLLVLDESNRLSMYRYWRYEQRVAEAIRKRSTTADNPEFPKWFGGRLRTYFDEPAEKGGDLQRLAAFMALRSRLTLISGGPGTGKTYTVARILALMIEMEQGRNTGRRLNIKLAAPTGKAAMRMVESIRMAKEELPADEKIMALIPEDAATLHRLLGPIPGSPYFRRDAGNPLDADVVIIDEASMVDLPMMAKFITALSPDTKLILLGDMNQLVSVEPGCVFGDICSAAGDPNAFSPAVRAAYKAATGHDISDSTVRWCGAGGLGDCLVKLSFSHRFETGLSIGPLSEAINNAGTGAQANAAWKMLQNEAKGGKITWRDAREDKLIDQEKRPIHELRKAIMAGYKAYLDAGMIDEAFSTFGSFRVFSVLRHGYYGIKTLNDLIEEILSLENVDPNSMPNDLKPERPLAAQAEFYERRPIMITQNDYSLNLFNGDVGIILKASADPANSGAGKKGDDAGPDRLVAFFESMDKDGKKVYRKIPVNMLPPHETAFAMTVHKAQGSEFNRVLVLLPPRDHVLFTKELIYTAITRMKKQVEIWCIEEIFKKAVLRKTRRASGLSDALQKRGVEPPTFSLGS